MRIVPVAYQTLRVPMSSALDEGSIIGVSSVAHLRDGNRAFKVWNEHSSSVLPSRWEKEIKQNMVMAFQSFALWQWQISTEETSDETCSYFTHCIVRYAEKQHHVYISWMSLMILRWQHKLSELFYKRSSRLYKTRCLGADTKVKLHPILSP